METKEPYGELLSKIDSIGTIKQVVNSPDMINQIISYNGDRHLLCALFDRINLGIKSGEISEEDLNYLRSGKMMDAIVNLDKTVQQYASRQSFRAERLDKINYVSLLEDPQTLAVSYTHPMIIDALCEQATYDKMPDELTWFQSCGTFGSLPKTVQAAIVSSVLTRGNLEIAQKLLKDITSGLQTYEMKNQAKTY